MVIEMVCSSPLVEIGLQMNVWKDKSAAWPVANPVMTCASLSDAGFPSNFVADPFLYMQVNLCFLL